MRNDGIVHLLCLPSTHLCGIERFGKNRVVDILLQPNKYLSMKLDIKNILNIDSFIVTAGSHAFYFNSVT